MAGAHEAEIDARLIQWNHYMHQPGYGSSYVLSWAAAPKLMEAMEQDPEGFKETYREVLSRGNDTTPEAFLQEFGIDINAPSFWTDRLDKMSQDVAELKQMHIVRENAVAIASAMDVVFDDNTSPNAAKSGVTPPQRTSGEGHGPLG